MKRLLSLLAAALVALGLSACEEGAFEKAGRSIDKAGEKAKDKIEDATH